MEMITQNSKSTQRMRIMRHLEDFGTLTSLEAMKEYGIMCLPSRISELRARGEKIEKTRREATNRYGDTIHFMEYRLIKSDDNQEAAKNAKGNI